MRVSARLVAAMILTSSVAASAAAPPDGTPNANMWRAYADRIPVGSTLSIRMTSGERLTAVLFVVDDTAITVKPKTRVPEPARRIPFAEVDDLRLRPNRVSIGKYVGIGAAVGAAVFLLLLTGVTE
jgi:hypothetical protein